MMVMQSEEDLHHRLAGEPIGDPGAHLSSQDLRALALQFSISQPASAIVYATLALYEGMYELLGDGSNIDSAVRNWRSQ